MSTVLDAYNPLTFEELQTEFFARGYDYLNRDEAGRARAQRWLNQSYLALCELYDWPFLETELTIDAEDLPAELDDMRHVMSVTTDAGVSLDFTDRRTILKYGGLNSDGDSPVHWYLVDQTLYTNPGAAAVTVHYMRVPQELVNDDDPVYVPRRYMDIIVDGAVIKALKDSDNWDAVRVAREEYDRQVGEMTNLLIRSSEPELIPISEE